MYKKKLIESPSMRGNTINTIINTLHEKNTREEQHSTKSSVKYVKIWEKPLDLSEIEIKKLKVVGSTS